MCSPEFKLQYQQKKKKEGRGMERVKERKRNSVLSDHLFKNKEL
jgi:hypothetical protein